MLIRMCWSSRYSGSEIIGVSCKDKLTWVSARGGLHEHGSPHAPVPNEQGLAGQTHEGVRLPLGQPLRWCLEVCGRRLYTFRVPPPPPLSVSAQRTKCYKSNTHIGLSYSFFLQCRLKIALGGSDLDSDYSLFPKICLAVVTITYYRVFSQSLSVRHSFQSQQFFFWAMQKGTDVHICSKSKSSGCSSSAHHARKWRTAPISGVGLVFDTDRQNTASGDWRSF